MTPGGAHAIMFHHFHGDAHPSSQGSISAEDLERIIGALDPSRILPAAAWLEQMDAGADPAPLCLTFDDGLLCQYEVARPVLQRLGLTAFWFVYSSVFEGQIARFELYRAFRCRFFPDVARFYEVLFAAVSGRLGVDPMRAVAPEAIDQIRQRYPFYSADDVRFRLLRDRVLTGSQYEQVMDRLIEERGLTLADLADGLWMTDDHLRELHAAGHVVGLHSYSHPMTLGELPNDAQCREYARNHVHLERVCGTPPRTVAHPANSYGAATLAILRGLGVCYGFRANMTPPREGGALNPSPLELAREDHANLMCTLSEHGESG